MAEQKYSTVQWVKRSGNRSFARAGIHDPDGQVVDINQENMKDTISEVKTDGLYLEEDSKVPQPRHVEYLALRSLDPEKCAEFYHDVFKMMPLNQKKGDPTYNLTDGRVTLKLISWDISDFGGMDANQPMLDHIGIWVEDADKVHREFLDYNGSFPPMAAPCWQLDGREEDRNKAALLKKTSPDSKYQYCDMNGMCFVTMD